MINADQATDNTTVLVVSMTIIITIVVMAVTTAALVIAARLAARRARQTPEYWRMLARVCDARSHDTPPAAAIDD